MFSCRYTHIVTTLVFFRVPGPRAHGPRLAQAAGKLLQHVQMEIGLSEPVAYRPGVPVVAVRQLFGARPTVPGARPGQPAAPRAPDAGVLRPHRDQDRIPERVPHLQSSVRHTHTHPLELVPVLCHKLRDRVRRGQLGVQPAGHQELVAVPTVHLLFLLVHPDAHHNR